jgi:pilus assembly protein Flp/PilA
MALSRGSAPFSTAGAFLRDERGATAIEYGLIAGLIALVIIGAMTAVFTGIGNQFNNVSNNL